EVPALERDCPDSRAPKADLSDLAHRSSPHFHCPRGTAVLGFLDGRTRFRCFPESLSMSIGLGRTSGSKASSEDALSSAIRTLKNVRSSPPCPASSRCKVAREIPPRSANCACV